MTLSLFDAEHIEVDANDRDTWTTPREIVDALLRFRTVWDLDPCSNPRSIVPAATRWTVADDGLSRRWFGAVYCNPPYSDPTPWMERCASNEADLVVGCIKCDPSVQWWNRYVWKASAICLPNHRLEFDPPPGVKPSSNNFASALPLWLNRDQFTMAHIIRTAFERAFSPLGKVVLL